MGETECSRTYQWVRESHLAKISWFGMPSLAISSSFSSSMSHKPVLFPENFGFELFSFKRWQWVVSSLTASSRAAHMLRECNPNPANPNTRFFSITILYYTAGAGWCFPLKNPLRDTFCDFQRVFPVETQKVFLKEKSEKHIMCFSQVSVKATAERLSWDLAGDPKHI